VSGSPQASTASSGVEKLLQMVEKFEASQEDVSLFEKVESKLFNVISCYIKAFRGERVDGDLILSDIYQIQLPENDAAINLQVEFAKPEMIKTEMELLEIAQKEIDMGLMSRVHVLMNLKKMTKEQAIQHIKEVDEFEGINGSDQSTEILEERSLSEVQP
jgi:hypothetical protein